MQLNRFFVLVFCLLCMVSVFGQTEVSNGVVLTQLQIDQINISTIKFNSVLNNLKLDLEHQQLIYTIDYNKFSKVGDGKYLNEVSSIFYFYSTKDYVACRNGFSLVVCLRNISNAIIKKHSFTILNQKKRIDSFKSKTVLSEIDVRNLNISANDLER